MPIYEYACPACSHEFSKLMKMSASPPPCPECGASEVTKKISKASFHLKGAGWDRDSYGLKKKPIPNEWPKGSAGDTGASSEKGISKADKDGMGNT